MAPTVKIASVVMVTPFAKKVLNPKGQLLMQHEMAKLTLASEFTFWGDPAETFELVVEGGPRGQLSRTAPRSVVGGRYLVGYAEFSSGGRPAEWPDGTNLIVGTVPLDPNFTILDSAALARRLNTFCEAYRR